MTNARKSEGKKTVAWVKEVYCPKSETFIFEPLAHFKKWRPFILAKEIENIELFPYQNVFKFNPDKYHKLTYRILNRLIYKNNPFENFLRENSRRIKPAFFHAHFAPAGIMAMEIAHKMEMPLLTTFYGYDVSELPKKEEWQGLYKRLFEIGSLYIVEGPFMKNELIGLGCPEQLIKINHIGLNVSEYPFKMRAPGDNGRTRILMGGRFVEKKGLEYGIKAFALALKELDHIELRIVGDGPLKDSLVELVDKLGISDHVKFLGFATHAQFKQEIFKAQIGLVPSVTAVSGDSEGGAPKTLLEMQASGLPVIVTDHADIPNVVLADKSAIVVPQRSEQALSEALQRMLMNPESWEAYGRKGSEYMADEFALEKTVSELEAIYDDVAHA